MGPIGALVDYCADCGRLPPRQQAEPRAAETSSDVAKWHRAVAPIPITRPTKSGSGRKSCRSRRYARRYRGRRAERRDARVRPDPHISPIHGNTAAPPARQMFIPKGHADYRQNPSARTSQFPYVRPRFRSHRIWHQVHGRARPCSFLSPAKRAVYAETDVIWVTVHLTKRTTAKSDLDQRSKPETIAPTYEGGHGDGESS